MTTLVTELWWTWRYRKQQQMWKLIHCANLENRRSDVSVLDIHNVTSPSSLPAGGRSGERPGVQSSLGHRECPTEHQQTQPVLLPPRHHHDPASRTPHPKIWRWVLSPSLSLPTFSPCVRLFFLSHSQLSLPEFVFSLSLTPNFLSLSSSFPSLSLPPFSPWVRLFLLSLTPNFCVHLQWSIFLRDLDKKAAHKWCFT